jgi:hypothetical protein
MLFAGFAKAHGNLDTVKIRGNCRFPSRWKCRNNWAAKDGEGQNAVYCSKIEQKN